MGTYFYAQLNEDNICIGVSQLSDETTDDKLIPLEGMMKSLLGMRHNNGEWHETPLSKPEHGHDISIDVRKGAKLQEINDSCQSIIYAGVDVETSQGIKHFSLTEHDQIELSGLVAQVKDGTLSTIVPYHADGEYCELWPVEDFIRIAMAAQAHIFYHRTYCNHLRGYVSSLETAEDIEAVYYGVELPEELAERVARILEAMGNA